MIIPLTEIDIAGVKTFFQNFSLIRGPVKYFHLPNITSKALETLLVNFYTPPLPPPRWNPPWHGVGGLFN